MGSRLRRSTVWKVRAAASHAVVTRCAPAYATSSESTERPSPAEAIAAAQSHGVDLTKHRSRPVTADVARAADLIVVMDVTQRRLVCERFGRRPSDMILLGDLDPAFVETRAIRDPVDQSRQVFDEVYERVSRCVHEFAGAVRAPAAIAS